VMIIGELAAGCPLNGDNQFGPRVPVRCRDFDFTLLFEDAFFIILPAVLFLLLLPWRLHRLHKTPVKMTSHRLAMWKLGLIAMLLVLHLLFLAFRVRTPRLHTSLSIASGVLGAAATLAAGFMSLLEDQRSLQPSDMLVLYFSASAVLSIPRLRSLWLISSDYTIRALWTAILVGIVLVVIAESLQKTSFLSSQYKGVTKEQTVSFWSRGFYIWILPFFQVGYSKTFQLLDIPRVDEYLEEESAWADLEASWKKIEGRHRLLRAALCANIWPFAFAIIPRLSQSVFTLCQPFLIETSVSYVAAGPEQGNQNYSQGLVGAFVLVYLGYAVHCSSFIYIVLF
jgi:ATP-binding cassette subfamily C (CFTR/MRP) protein 1